MPHALRLCSAPACAPAAPAAALRRPCCRAPSAARPASAARFAEPHQQRLAVATWATPHPSPEAAGDGEAAAVPAAAAAAVADNAAALEDTPPSAAESSRDAAPKPQQQQQQQQQQQPRVLSPGTCPHCEGGGRVPCKECEGTGRLKRGGFHKNNRIDLNRILDSKWTAMETTLGWRHFRCIQVRKAGPGATFLLLSASCDPSAQLWVNSQNLKDRRRWAAGWLQMAEILSATEGAVGQGQMCRSCSGLGVKVCAPCEGTGQVRLVVL